MHMCERITSFCPNFMTYPRLSKLPCCIQVYKLNILLKHNRVMDQQLYLKIIPIYDDLYQVDNKCSKQCYHQYILKQNGADKQIKNSESYLLCKDIIQQICLYTHTHTHISFNLQNAAPLSMQARSKVESSLSALSQSLITCL